MIEHTWPSDLLLGTWEARDARERGVPHWLLVPCLFLTLMFGPAVDSLRGRQEPPIAEHAGVMTVDRLRYLFERGHGLGG